MIEKAYVKKKLGIINWDKLEEKNDMASEREASISTAAATQRSRLGIRGGSF